MIHALLYVLFIIPFTAWLGWELKKKYSLFTHWQWLLGAFVTGIIGGQTFRIQPEVWGNFLMHATGGVASTLLFVYLLKTLHIKMNWRVASVILFAFVCMLGVLNELMEFAVEVFADIIMSLDSQDTWRDFVANTTGAALTWLLVSAAVFSNKDS